MDSLVIGRSLFEEMLAHLEAVYPLEGCGLLGGADGRVYEHYPVDNRLQSPSAFEMEPAQLVEAMTAMEGAGLSLAAIYHSHPGSAAVPSRRDIAEANYPEAVHIIVSFKNRKRPEARVYRIVEGRVWPITLIVV